MTEINLIYRFNISEIVYPSIERIIQSEKELNIISINRIRNEFLKGGSEIANEINYYIDNGKVIPTKYWCSLWTSMIIKGKTNVFISLINNLEQFKAFERCLKNKNYNLTNIIYLKVNDITKLTEVAKNKYSKIYHDSEILKEEIDGYHQIKQEVIDYSKSKNKVTEKDFFEIEIKI